MPLCDTVLIELSRIEIVQQRPSSARTKGIN